MSTDDSLQTSSSKELMTGTQLKHTVRSEDGKLLAIGTDFSF